MPSPLVALAWGSTSTSSTRTPRAARHAERLSAVVVFPTPPFWLAIAMILIPILASCAFDHNPPRQQDKIPSAPAKGWKEISRTSRKIAEFHRHDAASEG